MQLEMDDFFHILFQYGQKFTSLNSVTMCIQKPSNKTQFAGK